MTTPFHLVSDYTPAGDQPKAIAQLIKGVQAHARDQVLLGVTGSGKTFTMAHVIQSMQRPALIMAHNKTLAAQLYGEMKSFFPHNAVEYFVSYYDYYQPEAYVPKSDTFIEKDSSINEQIDRMRHSATRAMLTRPDVIVIASVSCIYGIGSVETYSEMTLKISVGESYGQRELLKKLVELQYQRNDVDFHRGTFRVRGDSVDIFPVHMEDEAWRLSFFGDEIESIAAFDPLTGERREVFENVSIFPNSHYVTPRPRLERAIGSIKHELKERLEQLYANGKLLEAQRLEQRTNFDLEMLTEAGTCKGIENYSRFLTGSAPGAPPPTLFQYLPKNALLFIDESHVTVPQIGGMFNGDKARKTTLVEYGFRLPSALDNRPLKFEEWDAMRPPTVFVSATPAKWELERTGGEFVEQIIRPTGLIDPPTEIRPVASQVDDLLAECRDCIARDMRVLVTTLTKRMAEELTEYMHEAGIAVRYLHSDVETLERIEIIRDLRLGKFQVLIGVNLLREGLDIPECGLVAILDADKEGFLRSATSLIQTIGRAARNVDSKVILYADKMTNSMNIALGETERRRVIQLAYNKEHNITPISIKRAVHDGMQGVCEHDYYTVSTGVPNYEVAESNRDPQAMMEAVRQRMLEAAANLEFEEAAKLRDRLSELEKNAANHPQKIGRGQRKMKEKQGGFTFIEIGLVMVIIGIMFGAVIAVQGMIHNAELRATMEETDRYSKAVQLFLDKYAQLPGDYTGAESTWGSEAACPAAYNATNQVKKKITCNGNGDFKIEGAEIFRAWQHLSNAGMIEGMYSGIGIGYSNVNEILGVSVPRSRYAGAGYAVFYPNSGMATAFPVLPVGGGKHFLALGAPDTTCGGGSDVTKCLTTAPALTAIDASLIDTKLDDGKANAGSVLAHGGATCSVAASYASSGSSGTGPACALLMRLGY